ncbi:hypothetical protein CEP54_001758 [Fusarium duplospermum]|uniref:Uncharacterized protein n=1 Tax=Fusarium duplospermum TaxID=1325734 RepID=A0A428QZ29_9HYPO|nr:hypothetical protein CEP54_001758 [Fusarium duplospermum]
MSSDFGTKHRLSPVYNTRYDASAGENDGPQNGSKTDAPLAPSPSGCRIDPRARCSRRQWTTNRRQASVHVALALGSPLLNYDSPRLRTTTSVDALLSAGKQLALLRLCDGQRAACLSSETEEPLVDRGNRPRLSASQRFANGWMMLARSWSRNKRKTSSRI